MRKSSQNNKASYQQKALVALILLVMKQANLSQFNMSLVWNLQI